MEKMQYRILQFDPLNYRKIDVALARVANIAEALE